MCKCFKYRVTVYIIYNSNIRDVSNNISAPQNRINVPITALKPCCKAGSSEPIFEEENKFTRRGPTKYPEPFP